MSLTNRERMLYLKGYQFWSVKPFWRDPERKFSKRTKAYYDAWLNRMQKQEKKLV